MARHHQWPAGRFVADGYGAQSQASPATAVLHGYETKDADQMKRNTSGRSGIVELPIDAAAARTGSGKVAVTKASYLSLARCPGTSLALK